MDMTPFYELRYRLICTAAAGCAGIGEDFRLHRAVANFQPLSAANKAFSRLSAMCDKLLHTPDSLLLADCIALANALAVARANRRMTVQWRRGQRKRRERIPWTFPTRCCPR